MNSHLCSKTFSPKFLASQVGVNYIGFVLFTLFTLNNERLNLFTAKNQILFVSLLRLWVCAFFNFNNLRLQNQKNLVLFQEEKHFFFLAGQYKFEQRSNKLNLLPRRSLKGINSCSKI